MCVLQDMRKIWHQLSSTFLCCNIFYRIVFYFVEIILLYLTGMHYKIPASLIADGPPLRPSAIHWSYRALSPFIYILAIYVKQLTIQAKPISIFACQT